MSHESRTAEQNAQEFRRLDTQGKDVRLAVYVACSINASGQGGGDGEHRNDRYGAKLSARRFSELAGTTAPRVLRYLRAWDDNAADLGLPMSSELTPDDVDTLELTDEQTEALASLKFYDGQRELNSRPTPLNIGEQLAAYPRLAEAAARELARPGGSIEHVDADTIRELNHTVGERRVRNINAAPTVPNPGRLSDRGKTAEQLEDEAYWRKVSDALHLLLDVKVKISEGVEVPGHISILMQILVPETDWDDALRSEIGNLL